MDIGRSTFPLAARRVVGRWHALGVALPLAVLAGLASCQGGKTAAAEPTAEPAKPAAAAVDEVQKANVEILRLRPRAFSVYATYIGRLVPRERVRLAAETEGNVEAVAFTEGLAVRRDQTLVQIATERLTLLRDLARSRLRLAEANYRRDELLSRDKLIPLSQLEHSRTQRDAAFFNLEVTQLELEKSIVSSPIDGTVNTKAVERGEFVEKGQLLAEILDVWHMRTLIQIPERQIGGIRERLPVTVTVDALNGSIFNGHIATVGLEADPRNRSFPVEVELTNVQHKLRAGMLGRVRIEVQHFSNQLLIPRHAVLDEERGRHVMVVENERARLRRVQIGAFHGTEVQVLEGLGFGDALVVRGQHMLSDNDPVRVQRVREQDVEPDGK